MIAKIFLFCAAVAAVHASWIGSGIVAPGYLNAGLIAPAAVKTSSVVAIPGAITADKRVIGTGILAGAPIGYGLVAPGLVSNGLVANGIWGAPLGLSHLGLRGARIIGTPGIVKTIW